MATVKDKDKPNANAMMVTVNRMGKRTKEVTARQTHLRSLQRDKPSATAMMATVMNKDKPIANDMMGTVDRMGKRI